MKTPFIFLFSTIASVASAQGVQPTTQLPACRLPVKSFPAKYEKLARTDKGYAWIRKAAPADAEVSGNGGERADGSAMYTWLSFYRVDLDNDGQCDWYLNASAPLSSGGDRDSINTLYLGRKNGWLRIGATVPAHEPDEPGVGKTTEQQAHYLFGEEIGVIHDAAGKTNYLVASFPSRHVRGDSLPGYRLQVWDADKKTLRLLDKWEPGSKAAAIYAFFKAHGARLPAASTAAPADTILRFDAEVDAYERAQACNPDSPQRSAPDLYGAVSRHLIARCKR